MIGLLLMTHGQIGYRLLETVRETLGGSLPIHAYAWEPTVPGLPDLCLHEAKQVVARLDDGDGVLVLTDIYGATPSNIAQCLSGIPGVRVIAGVNLPMLIRVMNYAHLPLDRLCEKALSGGHDGIVACYAASGGGASERAWLGQQEADRVR